MLQQFGRRFRERGQEQRPLSAPGSGHAFVEFLKARMEAGQFRAVIDRSYPLDAIAEAYRYVETGQKAGIVVIQVVAADQLEAAQDFVCRQS